MIRKISFMLLLLVVVAFVGVPGALATQTYMDACNANYNTTGTRGQRR